MNAINAKAYNQNIIRTVYFYDMFVGSIQFPCGTQSSNFCMKDSTILFQNDCRTT